jgi:ComF family protein
MGLTELIFPKFCLGCRKRGGYICANCLEKVRPGKGGFFKIKYLNGLVSLWSYEGVVRKAILALKYKFAREIAQELAEYFCQSLKTRFLPFQNPVLIPVALSGKRQNWRGFNQSEVLGKLICQKMNWDFEQNLVIRSKNTKPQVELSRIERKANVASAFTLNPKHKSLSLNTKPLVIFDDVITTGATLEEMARVLRSAGAKRIFGLTLAS